MGMKSFIKNKLRGVLVNEEYQVRDIDGPVYYKRENKYSLWKFISEEEYFNNNKLNH